MSVTPNQTRIVAIQGRSYFGTIRCEYQREVRFGPMSFHRNIDGEGESRASNLPVVPVMLVPWVLELGRCFYLTIWAGEGPSFRLQRSE